MQICWEQISLFVLFTDISSHACMDLENCQKDNDFRHKTDKP